MIVHILLINNESFDLNVPNDFTYDDLVDLVSEKMELSPHEVSLYHKNKRLHKLSKFDNSETELTMTALVENDFHNYMFPQNQWLFPFDIGRFVDPAAENMYPENSVEKRHPTRLTLRDLIPNIGYEYNNPFSRRPSLFLRPRVDHTIETQSLRRSMSGEAEERREEAERNELVSEEDWEEFRRNLTVDQQAAVRRLCGIGLDRNIVLRVFYQCHCDEAASTRFLASLQSDLL